MVRFVPIGDKDCRADEFLASTNRDLSFPPIVTGVVYFAAVCQPQISLYNLRLRLAVFRPTLLVFHLDEFRGVPQDVID